MAKKTPEFLVEQIAKDIDDRTVALSEEEYRSVLTALKDSIDLCIKASERATIFEKAQVEDDQEEDDAAGAG